jgi:DNA polymerase III delta subunit
MVAPAAYLFVGSDELRKHEKLELIAKELFPPELRELNATLLYGDDRQLSPQDLKEYLSLLPTEGAGARLLVLRMAHKLGKPLREALVRNLAAKPQKTVIVVDIPETRGDASAETQDFVRALEGAGARLVRFKEEVPINVFDLGRSITERQAGRALQILEELLRHRERAEKILGGLSWQWEKFFSQKTIGPKGYTRGIKLMLDADRKLKSSVSAYARDHAILEILVVRLSSLERE